MSPKGPIMEESEKQSEVWRFFDKVYCISLRRRADRRRSARRQFDRVGLSERVEFVLVDAHPEDCEKGIFESHLHCLRKGCEAGARTIAVFEDDVVFDRFSPRRLQAGVDHMAGKADGWMLFFGCLVSSSRPTECRWLRRVRYRSLAHGYAVSGSCAQRLSQRSWTRVPFDTMLSTADCRQYAICPSFAFQSNSRSDNDRHRMLTLFRQLIGGLGFIQRMNEYYHCHRPAIIILHLAAIAGILLALLAGWGEGRP